MSRTTPPHILQPKGTPIMYFDAVFRAVMSRFGPEEWPRRFRLNGVLPSLIEPARWLIYTDGRPLTPTVYILVEPAFSLRHGKRSFAIDAMVDETVPRTLTARILAHIRRADLEDPCGIC